MNKLVYCDGKTAPEQFTDEELLWFKVTREEITAWYHGTWTEDAIKALDLDFSNHFYNCDKCDECSRRGNYYCPAATALLEKYNQAEMEFSWQKESLEKAKKGS